MMQIAGQDAELPEIRRRAKFFGMFVMLAFLAIAGRLFYLQVVEGDTFYRLDKKADAIQQWQRAQSRIGQNISKRDDLDRLSLTLRKKLQDAQSNKPVEVAPIAAPEPKAPQQANKTD